jgi:hypothetical protein
LFNLFAIQIAAYFFTISICDVDYLNVGRENQETRVQPQTTNRKSNHRSGNLGRSPGRLKSAKSFARQKIHLIKFAPQPAQRAVAVTKPGSGYNAIGLNVLCRCLFEDSFMTHLFGELQTSFTDLEFSKPDINHSDRLRKIAESQKTNCSTSSGRPK